MEAREASVRSNHAAAARSVRAAAQARPPLCVLGGRSATLVGGDDHLADPEFEKEAWLSMVMLEWGSCGQIATAAADTDGEPRSGDDWKPRASATSLYAPPRAVPRALRSRPAGQRRRGAADVDGRRARARPTTAAAQPDRPGGRRSGAPRCARAGGVRPHRQRPPSCSTRHRRSRRAAGGRGAGGLLVRPVHDRRRLPAGRRVHGRRAAPVLPAAAPRAGQGPGLEGRSGGGAGAAAGERATAAAGGGAGRRSGVAAISEPAERGRPARPTVRGPAARRR